jgi:transcriptional regulator with XRE-family HTH domain
VALADELRIYVRELIADKGLNQKELAKAIGASQGYVSMILAGQRLGNEVTFLAKLAGAVDHTLSGLIAEAERRDLTRHGGMGQRDSHLNPGGSDVPASDRLREQLNDVERQLRDERRASAEKIQELRAVAGKLLSLLADEKDAATSARPTKSRRRHRRAG